MEFSGVQEVTKNINYRLYTALLWDSHWIGNSTNHSSTCLTELLERPCFNHMRFNKSN